MNDLTVWIIIAGFYAPLHFLLPILIVFLNAENSQQRQSGIRHAVINASLSMLVAFTIVIWLARDNRISLAMGVLFVSLLIPIAQAVIQIKKH